MVKRISVLFFTKPLAPNSAAAANTYEVTPGECETKSTELLIYRLRMKYYRWTLLLGIFPEKSCVHIVLVYFMISSNMQKFRICSLDESKRWTRLTLEGPIICRVCTQESEVHTIKYSSSLNWIAGHRNNDNIIGKLVNFWSDWIFQLLLSVTFEIPVDVIYLWMMNKRILN